MDFDESIVVLEAFKAQFSSVLSSRNAHGIQVTLEDGSPVVELRVTSKLDMKDLRADEIMPKALTYEVDGKERTIQTRVIELPIPKVFGQMGRPVKGGGGFLGTGTLGWNFFLNGEPTCMSNWHVLCYNGNNTPIGAQITISGTDDIDDGLVEASLSAYQPVYPKPTANFWDYALGKYFDPKDLLGFRPCQNGSTPLPPRQKLSGNVKVGAEDEYRKVGAKQPICRTGKLRAIGNVEIDISGTRFLFEQQLIFSPMASKGDSGAIVVRLSDNTVTGLICGGTDSETIANPVYRLGWEYQGFFTSKDGVEISSFTGDPLPASTSEFTQTEVLPNPSVLEFSAGKLYAGIAVKEVEEGSPERWIKPAPPPFRGVAIDLVLLRTENITPPPPIDPDLIPIQERPSRIRPKSKFRYTYLCFG